MKQNILGFIAFITVFGALVRILVIAGSIDYGNMNIKDAIDELLMDVR